MITGSTLIWLACSYAVGCYAEGQRRDKWMWILISLFISPLFSFIVLLFLGRK